MLQTYEGLCAYIEAKPGCTRDMPFDFDTLCFRVGKKIFVLMSWQDDPVTINLKCDPQKALKWRSYFTAVTPGYHMNHKHWNTVMCDGSVPDSALMEMINDSYDLVFASLSKAEKQALEGER